MNLEQARDHWLALAAGEDRMVRFLRRQRTALWLHEELPESRRDHRRTAQALQIQIDTGVAVCVCCHKPLGKGTRILSRPTH